jgi:hypothetical protein
MNTDTAATLWNNVFEAEWCAWDEDSQPKHLKIMLGIFSLPLSLIAFFPAFYIMSWVVLMPIWVPFYALASGEPLLLTGGLWVAFNVIGVLGIATLSFVEKVGHMGTVFGWGMVQQTIGMAILFGLSNAS